MIVAVIVAETVMLLALLAYAIRYARTDVTHLRSFTPVCPNCGCMIRATRENEAHAKFRLRDHLKECLS